MAGEKSSERAIRLVTSTEAVAPAKPEGVGESALRLDLSGPKAGFARTMVDLVFVIDTTGSMDDKIAGLVASCRTFADRFVARDLDWRIAVVAFGDLTVRGDKIVATGYTDKIATVHDSLSRLPRYNGGGNDGESSLEALEKMIALGARPGAMRLAILITDDHPLDDRGHHRIVSVVAALRERHVITFPVALDTEPYHRIARETGGRWFPVGAGTDLTSILMMFERVVAGVTETVTRVELRAGGDVGRYLALPPGQRE